MIVQSWTIDVTPFEQALRAAGIDADLTRVDFRAALEAALARQRFDLLLVDPSTSGLPLDAVEECLERSGLESAILTLDDPATLGERVLRAFASRRN